MPQDRLYLNAPLEPNTTVTIEESEFHHLKVLRIQQGEEIELVNGQGALAKASLEKLDKHAAYFHIEATHKTPPPSLLVSIAIPILRMNKLEWTIEKITELGADAIYLFAAHHSEKDSFSPNQLERLSHLTISALKQCGRLHLPPIHLTSFEEILDTHPHILFGDTRPNAPFIQQAPNTSTLFISGPEKGFSPDEISLLHKKGHGIKLNSNILRAETAPIAAISILKSFSKN